MMKIQKLYNSCCKLPFGKWIFGRLVCLYVPYFGSIKPVVELIDNGKVTIALKQRRAVQNHIKTVNIIALCNLCEMTMGMAVETSIPPYLRWIPSGMKTDYIKKATGRLTANTHISPDLFEVGRIIIPVKVTNEKGVLVMTADIELYVTKK